MKEKVEETYREEIICPNCKDKKYHDIPKGTSILYYKEHNKCERCKCCLRDWY